MYVCFLPHQYTRFRFKCIFQRTTILNLQFLFYPCPIRITLGNLVLTWKVRLITMWFSILFAQVGIVTIYSRTSISDESIQFCFRTLLLKSLKLTDHYNLFKTQNSKIWHTKQSLAEDRDSITTIQSSKIMPGIDNISRFFF